MKNTVRLNFEFPRSDYPYLKLMCAEMGLSFKDLATELILKCIEDYEDKKLAQKAKARLKELDSEETIPFDKAIKEAGWKKSD